MIGSRSRTICSASTDSIVLTPYFPVTVTAPGAATGADRAGAVGGSLTRGGPRPAGPHSRLPGWGAAPIAFVAQPHALRGLPLGRNVVAVEGVALDLLDVLDGEAGFLEQCACRRLAPGGAQPLAAERQRDGHAVHGRDGVHEWPERMANVAGHVTGGLDVDHQERAVWLERAGDVREDRARLGLIVDRIEDDNRVIGVLDVQGRRVLKDEGGVRQAPGLRLGLAGRDPGLREVVAGEAAVGEG